MSRRTDNQVPGFLTGVIAPMFTPRFEDGRLDLDGARNFVRWLKSRKCVSSAFARSGVGEMYRFTMSEAREFIATVVDEAAGDLGVLAGCAGEYDDDPEHRPDPARYTAQAVELSQFAQERGADAVVHVLPTALTVGPGETHEQVIFDYYRAVTDAVGIPVVLYQPPELEAKYCMTPALMRRLLSLPRIGGMKLSSAERGVFGPIAAVVAGTGFGMISGCEHFYADALQAGATGVIGGGCNTHPELIYAVQYHFQSGDLDRSRAAQEKVTATVFDLDALDVPGAVAGKLYIAAQGYPMQPYNRDGGPLPDDDKVRWFGEIVNERVAPHRQALQQGRELP